MDALIRKYFNLGHSNKEIRLLLQKKGYFVSGTTIKRRLRLMQLFRRKNYSPLGEVIDFVKDEIKGSGKNLGYKSMHLRCIQNNFTVTQNTIRHIQHVFAE